MSSGGFVPTAWTRIRILSRGMAEILPKSRSEVRPLRGFTYTHQVSPSSTTCMKALVINGADTRFDVNKLAIVNWSLPLVDHSRLLD
jgi:hypothetical protein